jgi:hypothetical protein
MEGGKHREGKIGCAAGAVRKSRRRRQHESRSLDLGCAASAKDKKARRRSGTNPICAAGAQADGAQTNPICAAGAKADAR